jgi:hypothetical protein
MSISSTTKDLTSSLRSAIDAHTLKKLRIELAIEEPKAESAAKRVADIKMSIEAIQKRLSQ